MPIEEHSFYLLLREIAEHLVRIEFFRAAPPHLPSNQCPMFVLAKAGRNMHQETVTACISGQSLYNS